MVHRIRLREARRRLAVSANYGRGWLILEGLLSDFFGVILLVSPLVGLIVLTWWIGAYALVIGVTLVVLAFKLRSRRPGSTAAGQASRSPAD
jgi:uncharacterized membrane protein HdeD (DUF308 family)